MTLCRIRFGLCFGLGLASFAANTRQSSGGKAGGDIDFAAFYILPMPSSLSAKWRRVKIGSLPSFSSSLRMPPKHTLRVRDHQLSGLCASPATIGSAWRGLRPRLTHQSMSVHRQSRSVRRDERHCRCGSSRNLRHHVALCGCDRRKRIVAVSS